MNVWRLVIREICHRKLNFVLGLLSVTVAVACLVGAMTLLQAYEIRTVQILSKQQQESEKAIAEKEVAVRDAGAKLQNAMRKITKGLGFNILILPKDQDLSELHAEGSLSQTMPENYVVKLANSRIVTVNHLLPMVMKKLKWEEMDQTIILTGTRGEVPLMHRDPKKPLQDPVSKGKIVLGYEVHTKNGLKVGDEVTLLDRKFIVEQLHPQRGTADDVTVWINLAEAQEMLQMQNLVNAILALECNCTTADRVNEIRAEIAEILPGTQIIERGPPALARAEARNTAKETAVKSLKHEKQAAVLAIERERQNRATLRRQREGFAAVLVPLVIIVCGLWIGFLTFGNVKQRSAEIGILRAIGLRSAQILLIFLTKVLLVGILGALIGYAAGFGIGILWGELPRVAATARELFIPELMILALVMAPLLSALAGWIPAMLAARQDPAVVLQED